MLVAVAAFLDALAHIGALDAADRVLPLDAERQIARVLPHASGGEAPAGEGLYRLAVRQDAANLSLARPALETDAHLAVAHAGAIHRRGSVPDPAGDSVVGPVLGQIG